METYQTITWFLRNYHVANTPKPITQELEESSFFCFPPQTNHLKKNFITKTHANGTEGGFQPWRDLHGQSVIIPAWDTPLMILFLSLCSPHGAPLRPLSVHATSSLHLSDGGSSLAKSHDIFPAMKQILRKHGLFLVALHWFKGFPEVQTCGKTFRKISSGGKDLQIHVYLEEKALRVCKSCSFWAYLANDPHLDTRTGHGKTTHMLFVPQLKAKTSVKANRMCLTTGGGREWTQAHVHQLH